MIVTGVDGSPGSAAALRWSLEEARLRQCPLLAVRAWPGVSDVVRRSREGCARVAMKQEQLDRAVRTEVSTACPVTVANLLVEAEPAEALMSSASDLAAEMIVVGRRGLGGVASMLLGSVSRACVTRADRTVAVIPAAGGTQGRRHVVVGVGDGETDASVLRWASEAADTRGAELTVVHAYEGGAYGNDLAVEHEVLRRVEAGVRAAIGARRPHRTFVEEDDPEQVLLDAARDAELLVLGAPRRNVIQRALGTTAMHCIEHSTVPVVVVRAPVSLLRPRTSGTQSVSLPSDAASASAATGRSRREER